MEVKNSAKCCFSYCIFYMKLLIIISKDEKLTNSYLILQCYHNNYHIKVKI